MANDEASREYAEKRYKQLDEDFSSWRSPLQDIKENLMPDHGRGLNSSDTNVNDGEKTMGSIYDGTALRAHKVLAGGFQSGLTSKARPWFRLAPTDPGLAKVSAVKEWIYEVEQIMRAVFAKSNFYKVTPGIYLELSGFGTAAVSEQFDPVSTIRFEQYTMGQYFLAVNAQRKVDTFARSVFLTTRQMVDMFGMERVSDNVKTAWDNKDMSQRFEVRQMIEPNDDRIVSLTDTFDKPWRSMWWQPSTTTFLRVAGFEEFPIMSPRWDTVAGDTYGRGLGREILPDTKMLYKMTKDYLLALDAKNNPTLVAPAGMKREFITTIPGGINYDSSAANQGLRPLHQNAIDLRDLAGQIGATQAAIQQGLFNQLFLMLANINDSTQRTATEIAARQEEKIVMLGPVLENLHTEFLDPVIKRTFNILSRTEQLPPPPEDIGDLEIEYVSILAQAQKSLGVVPLEQTVAFAGNLAGVKPDILDNIDFDQVMQHYGDFVGVPPDSMNPPEEVVQTRQARQQQEQMAQAAQMAESAAGSAKLLSEADLGGNNALAALTGGLGGLGGA